MKNRKRRHGTVHKDPLSKKKSLEHGRVTSKGIKKAKKIKHVVLKAAYRSKGMSKAQIASGLFAAGEEGDPESPSVSAEKRDARELEKKKPKKGTIFSAFARPRERET